MESNGMAAGYWGRREPGWTMLESVSKKLCALYSSSARTSDHHPSLL